MLQHIIPTIDYPSAFSNWLNLLLNFSEDQKEIAICGEKAIEFATKINQHYFPNIVIAGTKSATSLPFLKDRFVENETLFYVCQNQTCLMPTANFEVALKMALD